MFVGRSRTYRNKDISDNNRITTKDFSFIQHSFISQRLSTTSHGTDILIKNYLSGSRRFSPPSSRAVCRTRREGPCNCKARCSSDVRCIAIPGRFPLLRNGAADEDADDDGDGDARTRCCRKRLPSATRRAPRIDVSEQTDDASHNDSTAACRRSPAPSDACVAPGKRRWGCTAASRRSRWCSRPTRPPGGGDGDGDA